MQKKSKANLALAISAAGFFGTLPAGGFFGGLLHHGFLAATIGGLADWFAVTAIFRQPLGISYRTDILRRNRGRIMDALVTFASDDLLSVENIMQVVRAQDTATLFVDYLEHRGGHERLRQVVDDVVLKAVNGLDTERIAAELAPTLQESLRDVPLEHVFADVLRLLAEERHSRPVLRTFLQIAGRVLESPVLHGVLVENIGVLRRTYEKDSPGRAFVLSTLGLTDERIAKIICDRLERKVAELADGETEAYASFKAGFETMLISLSHDASLIEALAAWKEELLQNLDLRPLLAAWMEKSVKGIRPFWMDALDRFVDRKIGEFEQSHAWQRRFDQLVKDFLEDELTKHHDAIPGLIRERLDEMSDDDLVTFVEGKVQDDLQMIRINGAVVGSLVGMGLYILVELAERMWG
ncbi:MAG: DUF445 domain-containing protein [Selenomonadaceae bacterium]|nr:DUF445 domain-containing protein [Selenomonadaceae bacterium]